MPASEQQLLPHHGRNGWRTGGHTLVRRRLLRAAFVGGLGAAGAAGTAALLRFLQPPEGPEPFDSVGVSAGRVPAPGAEPRYFERGRFYLVNLTPGEGGIAREGGPNAQFFESRSERGGVLALYQGCTHMGCKLPWRADFEFEGQKGWFRCPCHGATYTKEGLRVFGPAPRSMDTMPVAVHADGSLTVHTQRIRRGGPDDPQPAIHR